MNKHLTVALDAMGGDEAPAIVVHGAEIARERFPEARFLFFGRESDIKPLLDASPALAQVSTLIHTDDVVSSEDKPARALRRGRKSSMALAIEAVKAGDADVAVSAGNTGALMALAKFILRTLPSIDRPALASLLPTYKGECVMLDLGANVECDASNLVEFSVMGAAFARTVLGLQRPKLSLLNIGVEELKGNEEVKEAAEILRKSDLPLEFAGFIEGDMIGAGSADVVVTDGFTGNVALKTAEGTARLIGSLVRDAFQSSTRAKLGYLMARRGLDGLRSHLDPNNHNGAVMLGLNGLVVKSMVVRQYRVLQRPLGLRSIWRDTILSI
ncbi:phosphate acyltransferase [Iodidimonas gelatinilytica]|uniref:Phosphate acyltransferase n=1 Tax=Iodidimonas gelatinilytica TaxID=1236966 RepID=A0A5A7MQL5_9PROT|nr:phosphate acyltransferase PlsX [Iodidimonas gelatinilytica]GEQ98106.1 phosphate acyltransferase [Iodidimonas gelatinilytica]